MYRGGPRWISFAIVGCKVPPPPPTHTHTHTHTHTLVIIFLQHPTNDYFSAVWSPPPLANVYFLGEHPRVLARISDIPVQNSNFKISARPDLATYLLQILIPATIKSLVCHKGQFTLQLCHRRWFVRKIFVYDTSKVKIETKQEVFRKLPVQKTGRTGPG